MRNNHKKEEIIAEALKLFYEKGFNNTNLKDIAEKCSIKKQSISYYFGSKTHLGLAVYNFVSDEIINTFIKKAKEIDENIPISVICAASMIGIVDYYLEDKKAFRFFEEFYFSSLINIDIVLCESKRHIYLSEKMDDITMDYIASMYAANGVLYYFIKGYLPQYGKEEFCRYYITTELSCVGATKDAEELDKIYEKAKELYLKITPVFMPYFEVR